MSADPTALDASLSLAAAAYAAGRLEQAAAAYERTERDFPGDVRAPYSLAVIDIRLGRLKRARRRLAAVTRRAPDLFGAWHNLGFVSQSLGLWPQAADAYGRALAIKADAAETGFNLAVAHAVLGRLDEAVEVYRSLARTPQTRVRALTRLAILAPLAVADDELEALAVAGDDAAIGEDVAVGARFALGEALEARGLNERAFAAFAAGNALKHRLLTRSPDRSEHPAEAARAHEAAAAYVKAMFTADFLADHRRAGASGAAPIFIVGMPRSGSSLIEQILSAHPAIQGMGESPALSAVIDAPRPGGESRSPPDGRFKAMADAYLGELENRGWSRRLRPVDKTLENYLHVGLIQLMFPRAVILHSVRDPIDTCLSCYRQLFAGGNETLYDLTEIGAEYVRYRSLMDHWRSVLPGRVIDVSHEALVADPEGEIRRLVTQHCGLAWDSACLRFHETRGAVRTASAAQVRRPIFTTSIQRWRRYTPHLAPLIDALGPYAAEAADSGADVSPADRGGGSAAG